MENLRKRVVDENEDPNVEDESAKVLNGVLPLTRIKKIIKMSANYVNVSAGSAKLIQLCAEEYLRAFVRTSKVYAEQSGRKTIQLKDLNRVIKDDWAFALLEDALIEWPNDVDKVNVPKIIDVPETDSSSLFHLPPPVNDSIPETETDTMLTNRDIIDEIDAGMESEFNETGIYLDETDITKATPLPTMEYLEPSDGPICELAEPFVLEEDDQDMDADAQRPHNNKFLNYRRIDEDDEIDSFEDDDKTLTPPPKSPTDFDIEDIQDI